jgi:hypothetical protein
VSRDAAAAADFRLHGRLEALQDFNVGVTFRFAGEHLGLAPHHVSAPIGRMQFAEFCAPVIERSAPAARKAAVA